MTVVLLLNYGCLKETKKKEDQSRRLCLPVGYRQTTNSKLPFKMPLNDKRVQPITRTWCKNDAESLRPAKAKPRALRRSYCRDKSWVFREHAGSNSVSRLLSLHLRCRPGVVQPRINSSMAKVSFFSVQWFIYLISQESDGENIHDS